MQLNQEIHAISKLKHDRNEFFSDSYRLCHYPAVLENIQLQLGEVDYYLPDPSKKGTTITAGQFELQTHERSVNPHTDLVPKGEYFGLYPVGGKVLVKDSTYEYSTELTFYEDQRKETKKLVTGELIIFNPRKLHSLTYYGEATTFMLFSIYKRKFK